MVGVWVFLCSLSGMPMGIGLYYYGIHDTTAAFASNFRNVIPIATFVFSIIARAENLKWKKIRGQVKIAGAVICLSGALLVSFYRGRVIILGRHYVEHPKTANFTRGTILLVASVLSDAIYFITQAKLMNAFPSKYWGTMLTCLSGSIQSAVIGICIDRRIESWKLEWSLKLLTVVYSGVLSSGTSLCIISWVISCKGPTYPTMFNPLSQVLIGAIEILFLGEDLWSGSLIGILLTIVGVYAFLWGNSNEETESPLPISTNEEAKPTIH